MPIQYVEGDAARPQGEGRRIIAQPVSTVGTWGSALAITLSDLYGPTHRDQYVEWLRTHRPQLGDTLFTSAGNDIFIAHMLVNNGLLSRQNENPLVYAALIKCLNHVFERAKTMNATVHTTRVGHGRAGGDWRRVEALLERASKDQTVTVYDLPPFARSDITSLRRNP